MIDGSRSSVGGDIPVDLELVLAVDGSASVSGGALAFQVRGHAAAMTAPEVVAAIGAGRVGAIAVTLVRYSDPASLGVIVPWMRIAGPADARAFAAAASRGPLREWAGSTAMGSALLDAAGLFADNGHAGARRVIDIAGNGFSNNGVDPARARDAVTGEGITVNGLAILNEFPWLEDYFLEKVIGGPGAFVRAVHDRESFIGALMAKLVEEIAGSGPGPRRQA
jgi:hypothetical protein